MIKFDTIVLVSSRSYFFLEMTVFFHTNDVYDPLIIKQDFDTISQHMSEMIIRLLYFIF